MLLLINFLINMDTNNSVSNFNLTNYRHRRDKSLSCISILFKLMLTHHVFCRYMHKYLANDQEYSVEFWISLSTSNKGRDVFNAWLWRQTRPRQFISRKEKTPPRSSRVRYPARNRCSGEARSRKLFSILFAMNNETTQSFLQFKCNEPHRYIPSYSFSGSPFSPPFTRLISCHPPPFNVM